MRTMVDALGFMGSTSGAGAQELHDNDDESLRKRRLRFTTAFHTKFPEILHAALKILLSWGYELFRYFHKASSGVMVPTQGVLHMFEQRGFKNLRGWTHGVDTELFAYQQQPRLYPPVGTLVRPVSLFVGRVSYEKISMRF